MRLLWADMSLGKFTCLLDLVFTRIGAYVVSAAPRPFVALLAAVRIASQQAGETRKLFFTRKGTHYTLFTSLLNYVVSFYICYQT